MKIISFSDIHLENPKDLRPPEKTDAELMILSGDILNMRKPEPLLDFLSGWEKPVLYVPGNHEYYNDDDSGRTMKEEEDAFRRWLGENLPQVKLLTDEAAEIGGVHFFGGTMWTDFAGGNAASMAEAQERMHDFHRIYMGETAIMTPADTMPLHAAFKEKLLAWLETPLKGPRVVITHHAPALHPQSKYTADGPLVPAFNSLDMLPVIEKYQPDFWFYGHTHECDRQKIGKTQLVSNQFGYFLRDRGVYECEDSFDPQGAPVTLPAPDALRQTA